MSIENKNSHPSRCVIECSPKIWWFMQVIRLVIVGKWNYEATVVSSIATSVRNVLRHFELNSWLARRISHGKRPAWTLYKNYPLAEKRNDPCTWTRFVTRQTGLKCAWNRFTPKNADELTQQKRIFCGCFNPCEWHTMEWLEGEKRRIFFNSFRLGRHGAWIIRQRLHL